MTKDIVFDIETYGNIRDFNSLILTVISIYRYETDSYHSFEHSELGSLWPIIESCDRLIGYNSEHFDTPILNKYSPGDLTNIAQLDMLKVIKESSGKRFKLDDVAKTTLGIQKSADGLAAIKWYEQGEMQKIKDYCEQDVKVTKELYDYGLAQGKLSVTTLTGETIDIPVDFSHAQAAGDAVQAPAMNFTLPL